MEDFISSVHAYRAWTWMGAFGAPSPKGTTLWSSRPAVQKMSRSLPAGKTWSDDITTRTVLKSGKPSVSGGKGLKESQAYTSQFGFATLSVWLEEDDWPESDLTSVTLPTIWSPLVKKDRWDDARLQEVMQYLTTH